MGYSDVPDLRQFTIEYKEEIELLRQNRLLGESQFLRFARDRGLPAPHALKGDPDKLLDRGWLYPDEVDLEGNPSFHPFRIYPLHRILDACEFRIAPTVSLNRDSMVRCTEYALKHIPSTGQLDSLSRDWNNVVTLATILEPLYWPKLEGRRRLPFCDEAEAQRLLDSYGAKVKGLVRSLDPDYWANVHEYLCIDARGMDTNTHLYLLLRVSTWYERERLKGPVSGALWIRHMAEVLRRAFEEVHDQRWPEEDRGAGYWPRGARAALFGSDRPLDSVLAAKPYLAHSFGLFTGSALRWYLEGDTEYFSVLEMVPDISRFGVELVNLMGGIASGKNNTPLRLEALLKEDRLHRRFSMISVDGDVQANIKDIRRQVKQGNVVGGITVHAPDFEFANFSLAELVEIAAGIDASFDFLGDPVRKADWTGIQKMKDFEEKYREVSARKPQGLKGEAWGRALARYAMEHPDRPDGTKRPLWSDLRAALHAWTSDYDNQSDGSTFDPVTLKLIPR